MDVFCLKCADCIMIVLVWCSDASLSSAIWQVMEAQHGVVRLYASQLLRQFAPFMVRAQLQCGRLVGPHDSLVGLLRALLHPSELRQRAESSGLVTAACRSQWDKWDVRLNRTEIDAFLSVMASSAPNIAAHLLYRAAMLHRKSSASFSWESDRATAGMLSMLRSSGLPCLSCVPSFLLCLVWWYLRVAPL